MLSTTLYTALDMTFGLLNSVSVQGYTNVRSLSAAMSNIEDIMKWIKEEEKRKVNDSGNEPKSEV